MTIEEEEIGEQAPGYLRLLRPPCRCRGVAFGGCRCEDDGTAARVEHERYEHEPGGYPRRA